MGKQDSYQSKTNLIGADYVTGVDSTGPSTIRVLLSSILAFVWNLANIPSGGTSPITRDNESEFSFVVTGLIWTADAAGSTLLASMTLGTIYINGLRISVSAVAHRAFLASNDTYVDVLSNGDGTGTLVYTTVTNNSASPALAANSTRIAIIVAGATFITNAASINQGQTTSVLPIASSIAYAVTDSLGNLIYPADPTRKLLGYRQITSNFSPGTTAETLITGLSVPFIAPTNRKVKTKFICSDIAGSTGVAILTLRNGTTVAGGTQIGQGNVVTSNGQVTAEALNTLSGAQNVIASVSSTAGNPTVGAATAGPAYVIVELD